MRRESEVCPWVRFVLHDLGRVPARDLDSDRIVYLPTGLHRSGDGACGPIREVAELVVDVLSAFRPNELPSPNSIPGR